MTKIKSNLNVLRSALKTDGVTMVLSKLKKNGHAATFWDHNGPEVWIKWFESSIKGAGAEAMRKLLETADKSNTMLRGSVTDDDGSGKLFEYYKSFGFVVDPAGGEIIERTPNASRSSATRVIESPEFKSWFGRSNVVDAKGLPLVVFHGTDQIFNEFKYGEFGFHFGSELQAADRGGKVMPVYLSLRNPIRFAEDLGNWTDETVGNCLVRTGQLKQNEVDEADGDVLGLLMGKGFDGFTYINGYEGDNEISYSVFDPRQIKCALNNSGDFDPGNPHICA